MEMPKKLRGPADVAKRFSDQQIFGRIDPELENLLRDNLLNFVNAMENNVDWGKVRNRNSLAVKLKSMPHTGSADLYEIDSS